MISSTRYLPDDLGLLLTHHNKVTEDNFTVVSCTGEVYGEIYGYLLDGPEVIQRRIRIMNTASPESGYGLWAGESFTGLTSPTKASMLSFVQGFFYHSLIAVLGLDYEEAQVHQLIKGFDVKSKRSIRGFSKRIGGSRRVG